MWQHGCFLPGDLLSHCDRKCWAYCVQKMQGFIKSDKSHTVLWMSCHNWIDQSPCSSCPLLQDDPSNCCCDYCVLFILKNLNRRCRSFSGQILRLKFGAWLTSDCVVTGGDTLPKPQLQLTASFRTRVDAAAYHNQPASLLTPLQPFVTMCNWW